MNRLTAPGAARFLLDRGLLTPGAVLDGGFRVEPIPGRNRNFLVAVGGGRGWFLKRGPAGRGASLLRVEAGLHRLAAADPRFRALSRHLPRLGLYDEGTDTLVVALVGRGESLGRPAGRAPPFPVDLARATGECLGRLHRDLAPAAAAPAPAGPLGDRLPWVLEAGARRGPPSRGGRGVAEGVLATAALHPALLAGLAAVRRGWRRETVIHGDVKGSNLVLARGGSRGRPPVVRLVDWECASHGDGTWDLGSAFHDYWLPAAGAGNRRRRGRPEAEALRALWAGYRRGRGEGACGGERLLDAVRCGGARLVQTAYETARVAGDLGERSSALLERAVGILRRPRAVAAAIAGEGGA